MDRKTMIARLSKANEAIIVANRVHADLDDQISILESQIETRLLTDTEKKSILEKVGTLKQSQDESTTALFQLMQARNRLQHFLTILDQQSGNSRSSRDHR